MNVLQTPVLQINIILLLERTKESAKHAHYTTQRLYIIRIACNQAATEMKELRRTANAVNVLTIKESHMTSTAVWTLTVTQGMR